MSYVNYIWLVIREVTFIFLLLIPKSLKALCAYVTGDRMLISPLAI